MIFERLRECVGEEQVWKDEPMKSHTTFRIGGPADYFVAPKSETQVRETIEICKEYRIPWYVIGNGSNLLVGDGGYRGVIIQIYRNMNQIEVRENQLVVQAGALLSKISAVALEHSLTGMEFASGIPGTIGGAAVMNAGAYGGEMKDILRSVTVLKQDGEIEEIPAERLEFGYRTSVIMKEQYVVLQALIELEKGDAEAILGRMDELRQQRVSKQPLEYPSAGSTFKRPEGYFAGKLIMDAGLRGYRVGDAMVSEKHCGFVVNAGQATATEVRTLMYDVRKIVEEKFHVTLEPEVKMLGEF